ncbi:hypothetical protein WJX72_002006 [[Myrmecia] bisecta]|uniref:Uncharacterized protein n=1 Tax=[Myrmecia] bisecta TaxID=41462 RepID=A0AAW1P1M8_9CHLO
MGSKEQAAPALSPCDVAALQKCLEENKGNHKNSGMPSTEEARGLLSALQQSVLRLCAAFYGLSSGAGPTLQKDLSSSATAVVAACCQLVTSIIADGAPEAEVLHLDSEHGSPSERHTSPESGAGSDEADDVDFEPDELTQQGSQLVAASLQLLQALVKLLKAAIKLLLQGDPPIQATSLEAWESVVFHCASLTTSAEDLGAALYPPQDAQQVLGAAEAIHTGAELLLEDLPEPALGAEQEALQSIGEQMQAAHAAVESKAGLIDDDASQPEE